MNFLINSPNVIKKKIRQLNFQKNVSVPKSEESPTIAKIRSSNGTKKLIDIFESAWIIENNKIDWWVTKEFTTENGFNNNYFKQNIHKNFDKIKLQELEKFVSEYLQELDKLKKKLTFMHDKLPGFMPFVLRNHNINVIGNISKITSLFSEKILDNFKCEGMTCAKVVEIVSQLIDDNEFYIYAEHMIITNSNKRLLDNFKFIVDQMRQKYRLDFNQLHCSDIIHMLIKWIEEVCNEYLKDPRINADEIAICMETETKLHNVLKFIEDAQKIGNIKEIAENNIEGIQKIYSILEKRDHECKKMLLLIPRFDDNAGYSQYPVIICFKKC
jgi:hypothetical protein